MANDGEGRGKMMKLRGKSQVIGGFATVLRDYEELLTHKELFEQAKFLETAGVDPDEITKAIAAASLPNPNRNAIKKMLLHDLKSMSAEAVVCFGANGKEAADALADKGFITPENLSALLRFAFTKRAYERIYAPFITDWADELYEARRDGQRWEIAKVRASGVISVVSLIFRNFPSGLRNFILGLFKIAGS